MILNTILSNKIQTLHFKKCQKGEESDKTRSLDICPFVRQI